MSDFQVLVVKIGEIRKHPNADRLSITTVEGYDVIFQTGGFQSGDLAVYIPIDAVVPTTGVFEFLKNSKGHATSRIKALRLRQIFSAGLLVPAPPNLVEGDDVAKAWGITKFEEPDDDVIVPSIKQTWIDEIIKKIKGKLVGTQKLPEYDVDNLRKNLDVLNYGEIVYISEKIHGCQFRACVQQKWGWTRFLVGSHHSMRNVEGTDKWAAVAIQYDLKRILRKHPNKIVYGELYGKGVQDLEYGCKGHRLCIFDVFDLKTNRFLDYMELEDFCRDSGLHKVPTLYVGPYSKDIADGLCKGNSTIPGALNILEGIVIRPIVERKTSLGNRVLFKFVSESYLTRKAGTEKH